MKLILSDLPEERLSDLPLNRSDSDTVITAQENAKYCIGCFGCWLKTPGKCVIRDQYQHMGELLSKADELVIVSKCSFGSYSAAVKNILDRSISYVLPFFEIRNREMHHKPRYANSLTISALFYGVDISKEEQQTACALVQANALNLNGQLGSVIFMEESL